MAHIPLTDLHLPCFYHQSGLRVALVILRGTDVQAEIYQANLEEFNGLNRAIKMLHVFLYTQFRILPQSSSHG